MPLVPSALRRAFPARPSLPLSSFWAGLTPAGPERAHLSAFTFKTTIAMCGCPLGTSHFQTGQLVWFGSSAARRVQWGAEEAAWTQHRWQECSSREETRRCFVGLSVSPPRTCYWCVSGHHGWAAAQTQTPEMFVCCCMGGCSVSPALLARVPAAGLGEMQLPMGKSHGFKVRN